jgi:hypothetical protein
VCLIWWTLILLLQINYIFSRLCKWTTHGDYSYGFIITNKDLICYIPWFFYMCIIVWFCTELEATKLQAFAYSTPPMFNCNKIYMKIHYLFSLSKEKNEKSMLYFAQPWKNLRPQKFLASEILFTARSYVLQSWGLQDMESTTLILFYCPSIPSMCKMNNGLYSQLGNMKNSRA